MLAAVFCARAASTPQHPARGVLFYYSFDGRAGFPGWNVTSLANYTGEWKVRTPPRPHCDTFERLLTMSSASSYSAISTRITPPVAAVHDAFVVQYEVRFIENVTCGGAYLKLFSDPSFSPLALSNETRHFMMFGPDLCADRR
jgi:calnexin